MALHKKWGFPLRISSVNVEIITEEILNGKLYFFVQCGDLDIFRSDYYFSSYNCSYYRHCWYYVYGCCCCTALFHYFHFICQS